MTAVSHCRTAAAVLAACLLSPLSAGAQGPRSGPAIQPADFAAVLGTPVGAEPAPVSTRAARALAMFGFSGALKAVVVGDSEDLRSIARLTLGDEVVTQRWHPLFGADSGLLGEPVEDGSPDLPSEPGIFMLEEAPAGPMPNRAAPVAIIRGTPFEEKDGTHLNGYHIGRYPAESSGLSDRYAPPGVFIEVTPENQDFRISEHFRLRQFLTKDQIDVWPKYLALDLRLVDKLELVMQELNAMGIRADRMHVMSGFRTPQYNGPGGDGRALLSRHTYGDAADVWIDNDGDGYMDDLNGDGRGDIDDAGVMLRAVDRVEARYPELIGGAGLYVANSAHGPFIHIDVRGTHARW